MINASLETNTDLNLFDKLEADVKSLTVEQVNAVIKKYISMDKLVFIMAGDFNKK
jgi:zinc protease